MPTPIVYLVSTARCRIGPSHRRFSHSAAHVRGKRRACESPRRALTSLAWLKRASAPVTPRYSHWRRRRTRYAARLRARIRERGQPRPDPHSNRAARGSAHVTISNASMWTLARIQDVSLPMPKQPWRSRAARPLRSRSPRFASTSRYVFLRLLDSRCTLTRLHTKVNARSACACSSRLRTRS
jgi:hypothetical protein